MGAPVENGKRERKIIPLLIVGVILLFAGGIFVAPLKWIIEVIGLALVIAGFLQGMKKRK